MLADFVILGANPFETSPEELARIPVEATYVDGVCRYSIGDGRKAAVAIQQQ